MDHRDNSEELGNSPQVNVISGERDKQFFDDTDDLVEELDVPPAPSSNTTKAQESSQSSAEPVDHGNPGEASIAATPRGNAEDEPADPSSKPSGNGLGLGLDTSSNGDKPETKTPTPKDGASNSREGNAETRERAPRLPRRPRGRTTPPPKVEPEPSSQTPPSNDDQDHRHNLLESLREEESKAAQPQPQETVVVPLIQPKAPASKEKGKFAMGSQAFFADPRVQITAIIFGSFALMILLLVGVIIWRRRRLQQDRIVQYGTSTIALKIAPVSTLPMFSDEEPPQWHPTLEGPIHRRKDGGQPIFEDIDWSGDEVVIETVASSQQS